MKVKIVIKFSHEKVNLIEQITVETDAPEMAPEMQNNLKKSPTLAKKQPITSCSSPMRYFIAL